MMNRIPSPHLLVLLAPLALFGCGDVPGGEASADTPTQATPSALTSAARVAVTGIRGTGLPKIAATTSTPQFPNGLEYYGGPIMLGTPNVYFIWYGNWAGDTARTILPDLITGLNGSARHDIMSTYYDGHYRHATSGLRLAGQTTDNYTRGRLLSHEDIQATVMDAITQGRLPRDGNGIYLVLTASDVNQKNSDTETFCTAYCGWHGSTWGLNPEIKFGFIGNSATLCPGSCGPGAPTPNGNASADGMASVMTHEIEETISDPELTTWATPPDSTGKAHEIADLCQWNNGTATYKTANGGTANVRLGARDFLIQQEWVNADGGFCAMSFNNIDVGVIPGGKTCPKGELVTFGMDDEDSSNNDGHSGWIGGFDSTDATTLRFCKVAGAPFTPRTASASGAARPYAVLKLGRTCPPGAVEFSKYIDNEDDSNNDSWSGDIAPNASTDNTRLVFCLFRSASSGASTYPDIGIADYGVLGPAVSADAQSGWVRSDDEDSSNNDSMSCGSVCADAVQTVSSGSNTTFNLAQAKQCSGSAGAWSACRGTGCFVCTEMVAGYPKYFANHPNCTANGTCGGSYYQCNSACDAPTSADM